jgi:hypothetical protein
MRYFEIIETMEMGKFDFSSHFKKYEWTDCFHEGRTDNIEWYSISEGNITFYIAFTGLSQSFICSTKIVVINDCDYIELRQAQTYKGSEGNNYLTKLMYFLKTQKEMPLIIGDIISSATIEVIKKANATGRFKMAWLNLDNNVFSDFTSLIEPNNNRIIIEHSKPIMPRYFEQGNPLSYGTLFN